MLTATINILDRVCGAHFNPAVSIAVLVKEGFSNFGFFVMIVLSQIIGGTLGVLIAYGSIYPNPETNTLEPGIAMLCPGKGLSKINDDGTYNCEPADGRAALAMFIAEAVGTFLLVSVILSIKYYHKGPNETKFFHVGLTLCGIITAIGPISGASFNPAVGLVQPIFQTVAKDGTKIS